MSPKTINLLREIPLESLSYSADERGTLGMHLPPGDKLSPFPNEQVIAVREGSLGSALEYRLAA